MKDITIIATADRLWDNQPREVQKAVKEAVDTIATGLMHLYEAKSVEGTIDRVPMLPTAIRLELKDCEDPNFMPRELASTVLTVAMVGAHSRANEIAVDEQKVMETPLEKLYPEDKDLFKGPEGGSND